MPNLACFIKDYGQINKPLDSAGLLAKVCEVIVTSKSHLCWKV